MTLSTATITDRFTVGDVIKAALRGISALDVHHEPSTADSANALLHMRMVLAELHAYSTRLRAVAFHTVTCVANQVTPYSLPDSALDVIDHAMWTAPGDTSETVLGQMGRRAYDLQVDKSSPGSPTLFYVHKEAYPLTVYFWPWPDEAGTVRFQVKRRIGSGLAATDELDMEEHWATYAVKRLAWYLAPSKAIPISERALLMQEANYLLRAAKRASNQGGSVQLSVPR